MCDWTSLCLSGLRQYNLLVESPIWLSIEAYLLNQLPEHLFLTSNGETPVLQPFFPLGYPEAFEVEKKRTNNMRSSCDEWGLFNSPCAFYKKIAYSMNAAYQVLIIVL